MKYKLSLETRQRMSEGAKKRWASPENRKFWSELHKGQKPWNTGKKRPEMTGDKHPHWKGGVSVINNGERASSDYAIWRRGVFKRDNYTCQICNLQVAYLHADHIESFADFPELRYTLSNGRTLCQACHYYVTFKRKMPVGLIWGLTYKRKRG